MLRIGFLVLTMLLGGCSPYYTLINTKTVPIAGVYTVDPQTNWTARDAGNYEAWTIDGFSLQAVRFAKGVEEGQVIGGIGKEKDEEGDAKLPKFRKRMNSFDIMELFVDTMTKAGVKTEARDLRPVKFGGVEGFRFDYIFVYKNGLEGDGFAVGAVLKDRLHLITYSGARGYHYTKYKDQADRIVQSIRLQ